jgi:AsmA protein
MPPQRRQPLPRRDGGQDGGSPLLTGALYAALGVIALAVVAVGYLVMAMPTDVVRDRVAAEVKARTGRDLVIAGPASFTLYPSLGVALGDVSLSGTPGTGGKPLVTMAALDVSVRLWPLIRREVRVSKLVLRQPEINLEVDSQGRTSWDFARSGAAATSAAPLASPPGSALEAGTAPAPDAPLSSGPGSSEPPARESGSRSKIEQLELGDVRIEDGTIHYLDARSGVAREVRAVNASLALPSISYPLQTQGSLVWRDKKVDFEGELTSVKAVLEDRPAQVALTVKSDAVEAGFDGTASFAGAFEAEGRFTAKSPSARDLANWLGFALAPSNGMGALDAKGLVRANGKAVSFTGGEMVLDGATATGQVTVETSGARPHVKANLKLSELDLNRYHGMLAAAQPSSAPAAAPQPQRPAPQGAAPSASAPPASIEDLLSREPGAPPGPRVKGFTQRDGWSEEPIDLSGLGLLDVDAKLSVGRLLVREIKVGQSELSVALKSGVMKTTFDDVRLYDGRGRGFITLDASSPKLVNLGGNITLEGISALPLLKDAAELDWLSGTGKLAFALAGQGQTERQIIETLNGRAEFTFTDGAIVGINIPQMVRGFGRPGGESGGIEKTDFSELASSWVVTEGIAENRDLALVSPLLRVTGSGSVMLPAREIDDTLRPKIVASLSGQGGDQNRSGIEIPVRVHGPLEKPKFTPDLGGAFKDPDKAVDTIKEIGKQFKGKSADEIVKGLFGSGDEKPGEEKPAKKLLDQFLKKQ